MHVISPTPAIPAAALQELLSRHGAVAHALGPLCAERLRAATSAAVPVEFLDDCPLQVERALDLAGGARMLFIDAGPSAHAPCASTPVRAARDNSCSSHAMSPQAMLQVCLSVHGEDTPPGTLLAVRGDSFDRGAPPTPAVLAHHEAAVTWAPGWLAMPQPALAATPNT